MTLSFYNGIPSKDTTLLLQIFREHLSWASQEGFVELRGLNLGTINLDGANLNDINLSGVYLSKASLRNVNFSYANLAGASMLICMVRT